VTLMFQMLHPLTRAYHPKLDGKFCFLLLSISTKACIGQICDEDGHNLLLDTPPPPHDSDKGSDDWTPYDNCLQFEVADFLFRRNQMSMQGISTSYLTSGQHLWPSMMVNHHSQILQSFMMPSTLFLLVT
jgi:hypothetical protein